MAKMVDSNDYTMFCVRCKTQSMASNKAISVTFCLEHVIIASLRSSSLLIKLSFYSTQYLILTQNNH